MCVCVFVRGGGLIFPSRITKNKCHFLSNFYIGWEYSNSKHDHHVQNKVSSAPL